MILAITCNHLKETFEPVIPSITVSQGPPLLQTITGLRCSNASTGTIPKCSFGGV